MCIVGWADMRKHWNAVRDTVDTVSVRRREQDKEKKKSTIYGNDVA